MNIQASDISKETRLQKMAYLNSLQYDFSKTSKFTIFDSCPICGYRNVQTHGPDNSTAGTTIMPYDGIMIPSLGYGNSSLVICNACYELLLEKQKTDKKAKIVEMEKTLASEKLAFYKEFGEFP